MCNPKKSSHRIKKLFYELQSCRHHFYTSTS